MRTRRSSFSLPRRFLTLAALAGLLCAAPAWSAAIADRPATELARLSPVSDLGSALSMYLAADFTAAPTRGIAPMEVRFIDRSSGNVASRRWHFGDGHTSTLARPSHLYREPGRYSVSLMLAGPAASRRAHAHKSVWVGHRDLSPGHWAFAPVLLCVEAGIVSGYPDGLYHPELAVTRDQMAVCIGRALAGGDRNVPEFTGAPSFPDVGEEHWALDYVEYAVAQNVIAGYSNGGYHPDEQVTRAQMAVYITRALVAPEGEDGLAGYVPADPRNFPDVPSDFWAYAHIEYCVEHGVVQGYEDGLYRPEVVVTRDQMAVYVARAFGLAS